LECYALAYPLRRAHTDGGMKAATLPLRIEYWILVFAIVAAPLGLARGGFEILTGRRLKDAIPRDFYLEGRADPVEKRNAALMETPSGSRVLFALVVTSGWASRFPQKYSGMLISEGRLSVCGHLLMVGSYGFGLHRGSVESDTPAEFVLYNQAGQSLWECAAPKNLHLRAPRPLQAILDSSHSARVYFGRYGLELRP
jgi:hypothetical protein